MLHALNPLLLPIRFLLNNDRCAFSKKCPTYDGGSIHLQHHIKPEKNSYMVLMSHFFMDT